MPSMTEPGSSTSATAIEIDSESVNAVVLDYGNVLYAWEPMAAVAGHVSEEDWEEFVADGNFLAWNERLDLGEPFEQVLADYARAHPDRPDWTEILALYRERFTASLTGPVPGMASVLDDLLEAGVVLYGLTNFDSSLFEQARLLVPQLEQFAGIVVSGREQHPLRRPAGPACAPLLRCGTATGRTHLTGPASHAGAAVNPAFGGVEP